MTLRLLVVDDYLDLYTLYSTYLSHHLDIECTHAPTGHEALTLLKTQRFDVITLDIGLPDMRGTTLIAKARHQDLLIPPTIVISGNPEPFVEWSSDRAGALAWFVKPFSMKELLPVFQKVIDNLALAADLTL